MDYEAYKDLINDDIKTCLDSMGVQPILFFGSGMSRRYIGAPSWEGLLAEIAGICPNINKGIAYYKQKHADPVAIGTEFSELVREWAWEDQDKFPSELFESGTPSEIYIKYMSASIIQGIETSPEAEFKMDEFSDEIVALKNVNPYSIITTNYDQVLEALFSEYTPVVGQEILGANYTSIGEIFKMHGCVTRPDSLILTKNDYDEFSKKKKYLSAKLLTFFAEHPLIILGYSAQDPNVKSILSDIDEILV